MEKSRTINWTPEKLAKFRTAYSDAVAANVDVFTFDDNEFLVGYAKYLIEYLAMEFNK